jgi:serine/threonine protein kinase
MSAESHRLDEVVGGKYRIVRFLASGGMGSVYEAQQIIVRRRFAVKFLHPELALRRELLTRFQREAEAAGALESENVAAALDFGIAADGAPYIVLEYLVGESLEQLREREERLPALRAVNLVQQACRGVQAAHAAGIVHRDLKPHNLFVCRRGDGTDLVKVLDFGVAKLEVVERGGAETRTGTVLGTPSYMSPEQARGEKKVDHLSDVYALGAVLYELLSGKKPHPGDSHNAILHHIATQPAIPLTQALPDLPAELAAVVERTLRDDVRERPASAGELAEALAPWSRAEVWPAPKLEPSSPRHSEPSTTLLAVDAPAAAGRPSPLPVAPVSAAPSSAGLRAEGAVVEPRASSSRAGERSRAWVITLAAALAVAVVIIFVLARGEHGSDPPLAVHEPPSSPRAEPADPSPRLAPGPMSPSAPALKLVDVTATAQSVERARPVKGLAPVLAASAVRRGAERPRGQLSGRPPAPPPSDRHAEEAEFAGPGPVKAPQGNPYE